MPRPQENSRRNRTGAAETAIRCVALLRGVNVGGRAKLPMSELRQVVSALGYRDVSTILQSGNIVFSGPDRPAARVEAEIKAKISKHLGLRCDVLLRTQSEWAQVLQRNPFSREAAEDASHLLVMFLKSNVTNLQIKSLQADIRGRELISGTGRELYITYPDGIGRSRLTGTWIEKTLSTRGTARNWNTLLRIAEFMRNRAETIQ